MVRGVHFPGFWRRRISKICNTMIKDGPIQSGSRETLKSANRSMCPARAFIRWETADPLLRNADGPMFRPDIRKSVATALKMACAYVGLCRSRIGNHSMRSGVATLMFAVESDIEIIKSWGRWISPAFHPYIWRDGHILSHVGRGMLRINTCPGRAGGKRGMSQVTPNA